MIRIGENVRITSGCKILSHDYSYSVIAAYNGHVLGGVGYVEIGNNVFIGMNSIILKDTTIGNNVIIGAGSVVSGVLEDNSIYAGVPAKKIMSLEQYYKKKKDNILKSCQQIYDRYFEKYGKAPEKSVFKEYHVLYTSDPNQEEIAFLKRLGNNKIVSDSLSKQKIFDDFDDFLQYLEENSVFRKKEK